MFKENQSNQGESQSIIGPSVKVEGDFITEENMIIEGMVSGTIKTTKNLKVGPKSKIFADVQAENILVAGEIQGSVKAVSKLELTSSAKVYGDIKADTLIVASGSKLNGKCQVGGTKEKSPKPDFSKQGKIALESKQSAKKEPAEKDENKKASKK
jgi:cytoskeletal protein CcmA (bactofilin family)